METLLSLSLLNANIGKTIEWNSCGNNGVAKLIGVRKTYKANGEFWNYRLDCETIEGEDLGYAFLWCKEDELEAKPEQLFYYGDYDRAVCVNFVD